MYLQNLKNLNYPEIIIYHHLGLGDLIICNGLVNYFSDRLEKIYLIVDEKFKSHAFYLYKDNHKVEILSNKIERINRLDNFVEKTSNKYNLPVLKIGWKNYNNLIFKIPFYKAFYKQVKLPYSYSYKYFNLPTDHKSELELKNHLYKEFKIDKSKNKKLIHCEASNETYNLNIDKTNSIFVNKDTDIFNNIFLYRLVANKVNEIHCVNSSFIHLIDRIDTNAKLYYHHIRGSSLKLKKNWKVVDYEN